MARRVNLDVVAAQGRAISVPTEFILSASERDDDGIAEAIKATVKNAAKQLGSPLNELDVGQAKPFGVLPLSPDIFDLGQRWTFTPATAGTFNNIINAVRTPRDTRILITGFADRSPSPQFVSMQFSVDGDTQPLLNIERIKNFGLSSQFGREAYFPRDMMLEIGGNRLVTLSMFSTGTDEELFQLLGIQVVTRSAAISQDIGALTS